MRPPAHWGRCHADTQQDSGTGVVLVKLSERASRRDPDVVQNCSICRHVATAGSSAGGGSGGVQGRVVNCSHRPVTVSDRTDDDDEAPSHATLSVNDEQFDRY